MATTKDDVLEVIRELPGLTPAQIAEHVTHINPGVVRQVLSKLTAKGEVLRELRGPQAFGTGRSPYVYRFNPTPTPLPAKLKLVGPTPAGLQVQLQELKAQVRELQQWKNDATVRYPDLAVDPLVLKARKIAAARLEGVARDDVLAGRKDKCPIMLATIDALGWSEAA